ncbi:MAG: flagellar basal body rod protein FlgB [Gammaproteobacteria bacterium]|nr:flagellar basal body rod protein FlgB [Gammaproteobacteria bacterium]NVK88388.1 flagellar basal body rod protein FlgB [Gammaproteobacteria bacterium]
MAISFDKALGIHEQALNLRAARAEVIANNIANADTPGYKAQDIDFTRALQNAMAGDGHRGLLRTHEKHFSSQSQGLAGDVQYVNPEQPDTGDGNTVDSQKEIAKYGRNAMEYQTTLQFLSNRFKGLSKALKGE